MGWTEWANDVVWQDTIGFDCGSCDFVGDLIVQCEGNGVRWSAYVECPTCGADGYEGSN
jgi:hypothetical protein